MKLKKVTPLAAALLIGGAVYFIFGGSEAWEVSGSYACPMLCVVLDHPGLCPVCGMELEEIHRTGDTLLVSDTGKRLAAIETAAAETVTLTRVFRAPATVEPRSEALVMATSWAGGRITDVRLEGPGQTVSRGEILAVVHSPEVVSAGSDLAAARFSGDSVLIRAALGRLEELGVSGGTSQASFIRAPVDGVINEVFLQSGAWMTRGAPFASILDGSGNELRISLPQDQAVFIVPGLSVQISGAVVILNRVEPVADPQTRTIDAYAGLPDSMATLPGTRLIAELHVPVNSGMPVTAVPESAVLRLGSRSILYVQSGEDSYVPRVVAVDEPGLDAMGNSWFPVTEGVLPGELVVVNGAFLLDSQAELTGITSLMNESPENE